jgi:flagellar hook-basal body complex protein FliE
VIRISNMPSMVPAMKPSDVKSTDAPTETFGEFLQQALNKVEQAQNDAATAAQRLASGEITDVAEVMIASEKATLALQLTVQVRNKVIEAYQEMMRMPV